MRFARTVTKKQKKDATKKKLAVFLIFSGLIIINALLIYRAFFEKPKPILSPMSKNQISSTEIFEKKLKDSRILYKSFTTEKDLNYLIELRSGAQVLIDAHKDFGEQLSSLQLILKQLKIEGKALKRLDFRYEKPIITL